MYTVPVGLLCCLLKGAYIELSICCDTLLHNGRVFVFAELPFIRSFFSVFRRFKGSTWLEKVHGSQFCVTWFMYHSLPFSLCQISEEDFDMLKFTWIQGSMALFHQSDHTESHDL